MEYKVFGETLAKLRKKFGFTQQELAEKLGFSNKTVSKWENAETLPEITVLPKLASIFGVSVDYLLQGERKCIAFMGDFLVDRFHEVDAFPNMNRIAHIKRHNQSIGGCVPCTAINLAKIDRSIPISVWGCIGDDDDGRYISAILRGYNININPITVLPNSHTGFCEEMNQTDGGGKMFFYSNGANALFGPEHVDIQQLQCQMLHVGYLLVLDRFEEDDREYGNKMARFLHSVQEKGIRTSADIASIDTWNRSKDIVSVLKYLNYLICSELECCNCFNLSARNADGTLNLFNIKAAMRKALQAGVNDKVIVHSREASFIMDKEGEFTSVESFDIPKENIRSSTGAGDAFCAGCLYAINNNFTDKEILDFASAAGACNLSSENSTDGMKDKKYLFKMIKELPRKNVFKKGE
ncbi:MAG: helix-turn-helix domain-containing protein [Clostridia bacterium]|nr:helix-turn-helix domain-containing protein [Clostridia bacterium]